MPMGSSASVSGFPFPDSLMARYEGGLVPQGISAEIIAERWDLGREELDKFSARSHILAGKDVVCGNAGRDLLRGGPGRDRGPDGVVLQEVMLLNDTLRSNIVLGREMDDTRLCDAAEKAA